MNRLVWVLSSTLVLVSCSEQVDTTYRTGLVAAADLTAARVASSEPSVVLVSLFLRNDTTRTLEAAQTVKWAAADVAGASFDLAGPGTMRCSLTNPWEVAPGATKEVRMRLDLRADPAILVLACDFDPTVPGYDALTARSCTAPRSGATPGADFYGPLSLELEATLDGACTPDDCSAYALVKGSTMVDSAP